MKTEIDIIDKSEDGTLFVRMRKINAKGEVRYHRTSIPSGHDIEKHMALVNEHIERLNDDPSYVRRHGKLASCPQSEISRLVAASKK